MSEKAITEVVPHTHDEYATEATKPKVAEAIGGGQSVGVNIVTNPLMVSFLFCFFFWPLYLGPYVNPEWYLIPPQRVSREQAIFDAQGFAEANNMAEHSELFGRAALVARNPKEFDTIPELDNEERAALAYERDHKWHGPFMLWYSIGLCAVGAATQGWDQTGANGANLSFPEEFGINGKGRDEWIVGIVNSIIFLTAGLM